MEHCMKWQLKEQLALVSAISRQGSQNWPAIARSLRQFFSKTVTDCNERYTTKNCAQQYRLIVDQTSSYANISDDTLLKKLTLQRINEIETEMIKDKLEYKRINAMMKDLQNGVMDSNRVSNLLTEYEDHNLENVEFIGESENLPDLTSVKTEESVLQSVEISPNKSPICSISHFSPKKVEPSPPKIPRLNEQIESPSKTIESCTKFSSSEQHLNFETVSSSSPQLSQPSPRSPVSSVPSPFPSIASPASSVASEDAHDSKSSNVDKKWKRSIMILWKCAANHKWANIFMQPVTDDIAPRYSKLIRHPHDLASIKRRIETGAIKTNEQFVHDIMLMFLNAIMYNSSSHDVFKMASEMQRDVMGNIQQYLSSQFAAQISGSSAGSTSPATVASTRPVRTTRGKDEKRKTLGIY